MGWLWRGIWLYNIAFCIMVILNQSTLYPILFLEVKLCPHIHHRPCHQGPCYQRPCYHSSKSITSRSAIIVSFATKDNRTAWIGMPYNHSCSFIIDSTGSSTASRDLWKSKLCYKSPHRQWPLSETDMGRS